MIATLVAFTLLSLADGPDLYDEPIRFDIGQIPCTADNQCFVDAPLCNTNTGDCVECLGPEHCEEGWACGPTGYCRDACVVDRDCEGIDGQTLCNPETGFCTQCLSNDDCLPEQYCTEEGWCRIDVCVPGQTYCADATIMQCSEDGSSGTEVEVCPEACEETEGPAQCVAGGTTGGSGGDGSGGVDGTGGATGSANGGGASDSGGSGGSSIDEDAVDKGCACHSTSPPHAAWAWLLVLGAGLRRREARPRSSGRATCR